MLKPKPTTNWGNSASRTLEFYVGKVKTLSLDIFAEAEYYMLCQKFALALNLESNTARCRSLKATIKPKKWL